MADIYFDMTNPFEKAVCERLNGYMNSGLDHDKALEMIGRDFPYMDTEVQDHCNSEAFAHYYITDDGNLAASMKRMLLNRTWLKKTLIRLPQKRSHIMSLLLP